MWSMNYFIICFYPIFLEQEHDTKEAELTEITFKPSLATFEQDLMGQYGIKEDRVPAKTYWY